MKISKLSSFTVLFFLLFIGSITTATAHQVKPIKVLIVDGFSNHDWRQTTAVTKWILERAGHFTVSVSTIPSDSIQRLAWLPLFKGYDVVIQNTNNINNKSVKWPLPAQKALEKYVAEGGGLYVLHSANNAFADWEEYNKMIGLGWRNASYGYSLEYDAQGKVTRHQPGESESTTHGKRFDAVIKILHHHPINKGYPSEWMTADTEVYSNPRGPAEHLTVLSYAYDINSKRYWPTEWVVQYGKGRVYNSTMGHLWTGDVYPKAWRCVGHQTNVIRVTEWLATGKVTYAVPRDFPTKDNVSLRPEDEWNSK